MSLYILSHEWLIIDRVWLGLLTTSTHNSWPHLIIAPLLISMLYKSPETQTSVLSLLERVSTNCFLVMASSSGDSSASMLMSLLSCEYPTTTLSSIVLLITARHSLQQFYCCMWTHHTCLFRGHHLVMAPSALINWSDTMAKLFNKFHNFLLHM
jgi:hypothetical protein